MSKPLADRLAAVDPAEAWQPWRPDDRQPFDARWAAHLYRRAGFGASAAEVQQAVTAGPDAVIERLLVGEPAAAELAADFLDLGAQLAERGDPDALRGWWLYVMLNGGHPLREKLTLFWHNHFATSIAKVRSAPLMLRQNATLREHALGKFGPFLMAMSRDPAMLVWLDSNNNIKGRPNENYAREVMELFSLGVGNYTEKDIREAARAFTGWHTDGSDDQKFTFDAALHDDGEKTVLGTTGKLDGTDIVRIALEQQAASRFLVGKLYEFFVSETPPPAALLAPLCDRYRKSGYDTADLVRVMLSSRLFFSAHAYRQRVKSPVEFALGAVKALVPGAVAPTKLVKPLEAMGQQLFAPPNVKGWRGGKNWLNHATVLARNNFAERVAMGTDLLGDPNAVAQGGGLFGVRAFTTFATVEASATTPSEPPEPPAAADCVRTVLPKGTPPDAANAVNRLGQLLLPGDLPPAAAAKLKVFLSEGAPKDRAFRLRVREAAHAVLCLPEYQLC
jgi:uncharacterized protein (DUF1800 family)